MDLMRLIPFNVFSKKATEVHRAIVQMIGLEPKWSNRDYENFAKEGYNANVWVNRCIQAVSRGAAGVPWLLYQVDSKGQKKELQQHELIKLLDRPNEFTSRQEFIESYAAFSLIAGNTYMDMVGPNDAAPPRELWIYRPDRMQIVPHKTDFIAGYVYSVGGQKVPLDKRRISHLKYFNPLDDLYGLSPIEVAARGIDNDNAANTWNNSLLTNGGRPSGAMVTDDALTEFQYDNLKKELEGNYKGAKNAGKFMLLEGGLKWQDMSLSPRDMDFILSKKMSILEICAAFSVPPEVVGYGEQKTYSNYQEARKALYEDAILPMLDRIRDKLNADLVPKFGDNLYLDYDVDSIEALKENQEQLYKLTGQAYKDGLITKNEGREKLGYEDVEGGDEFFSQPTPSLNINGPNKDDESKNKDFFLTTKAFNLVTEDQKTMYFKSMERRRSTYYKRMAALAKKRFEDEKKAVLKAFKDGGEAEAINAVSMQQEQWQELFVALYVEVMRDFGNQLFNQLKNEAAELELKAPDIPLEDAFNVYDEAVQTFIANTVAKKVVQVTDTTKGLIRAIVRTREAEGASVVQIAEQIDNLYLDQIIPNRSTVIARTEVIGASNAGNRFAAKQTNLNLEKEWIATRDKRTRESHEDVDGEKQGIDEPYSNGLMYPGDPNGRADEVIQCRCTEAYKVLEDDRGNLI